MRRLLVLLVLLLLPSAGQAVSLKICNAGKEEFRFSMALWDPGAAGGSYAVFGFIPVEAGACWESPDTEIPQIDLLVLHPDAVGRIGAAAFDASFLGEKTGPFSYQTGDNKFCIHPNENFARDRISGSETYCEDGMFIAPFPIRVVGTQARGTLNIAADDTLRHDDAYIPIAAPKPAERGDGERISLVKGPSAEQIAGAELRDLRKRLAVGAAFLGLKSTDIAVGKVNLDYCVVSKEKTAYCYYKAEAKLSNNELGALAGLVNLGFMINGFQWSSFVLRNDRWEMGRKYEHCRVSETNVHCTYRN